MKLRHPAASRVPPSAYAGQRVPTAFGLVMDNSMGLGQAELRHYARLHTYCRVSPFVIALPITP
jgi:hypothetical protein